MSSGPANAVMDRGPSRPAAGRQRIDVSLDDKRILEAASRTPAVLEDLNIQWHMTSTVVKPVVAKVADIGAAALRKLLGTVEYLGPPFAEQVDITRWCLPDRTTGPVPKRRRGAEEAAEPVLQLPSGLRAAVGAVLDHARGTAQQASEAMGDAMARRGCVQCVSSVLVLYQFSIWLTLVHLKLGVHTSRIVNVSRGRRGVGPGPPRPRARARPGRGPGLAPRVHSVQCDSIYGCHYKHTQEAPDPAQPLKFHAHTAPWSDYTHTVASRHHGPPHAANSQCSV